MKIKAMVSKEDLNTILAGGMECLKQIEWLELSDRERTVRCKVEEVVRLSDADAWTVRQKYPNISWSKEAIFRFRLKDMKLISEI